MTPLLWIMFESNRNGERYVLRFDVESLPLLREKLADLVQEDVVDLNSAQCMFVHACSLASQMEVP